MKDQNAAALNKKRKTYVKTCPICKKGFEGVKVKVFCSNTCRQKNKRDKADIAKRGEFYGGVEWYKENGSIRRT